jgi:dTDP-4-amino-4,6-dideoxygalactose transaminase
MVACTPSGAPDIGLDGPPVRFQAPALPPLDALAPYYRLAEEARWYANGGPCAQLLSERLAAAVGGGAEAVLVSNATAGLLVALRAVVGEAVGDRRLVVLPSFTFVATAAAVQWAGFEPLLVDVDTRTWHLDLDAVDAALEARAGEVAAVLACSTFGTPPTAKEQARLDGLAAAHGIGVVYDSAAAFGACDDQDRPAGRSGHAEVFSFHATKPFAVGEGGCVTTAVPEIAQRLRELCNFGFDADRRVSEVGINAKMSELHAATGLAVLDRYDALLHRRRLVAARYREALEPLGWRFQAGAARSTVQFVPVLAPSPAAREDALQLASENGIELRTYFDPPLHQMPAFAGAEQAGSLSGTSFLSERALSLPMADDIDRASFERVVACCRFVS